MNVSINRATAEESDSVAEVVKELLREIVETAEKPHSGNL